MSEENNELQVVDKFLAPVVSVNDALAAWQLKKDFIKRMQPIIFPITLPFSQLKEVVGD